MILPINNNACASCHPRPAVYAGHAFILFLSCVPAAGPNTTGLQLGAVNESNTRARELKNSVSYHGPMDHGIIIIQQFSTSPLTSASTERREDDGTKGSMNEVTR